MQSINTLSNQTTSSLFEILKSEGYHEAIRDKTSLDNNGIHIDSETAYKLLLEATKQNNHSIHGHVSINNLYSLSHRNSIIEFDCMASANRRFYLNNEIVNLQGNKIKLYVSQWNWYDFHIIRDANILIICFSPK